MKKFFNLFAALSCLFISCNNSAEDYDYVKFKHSDIIESQEIDSMKIGKEMLYASKMVTTDRYLIVMTPKEEPIFNIFDLKDMSYKGGFGKMGHGPKEFLLPVMSSLRGGETNNLFIMDYMNAYDIRFPEDSLITDDNVSMKKICKISANIGVLNSAFPLNKDTICGVADNQDRELTYCTTKGETGTMIDYPQLVSIPDETRPMVIPNIYRSSVQISPDRTKIAFFYYRFPLIKIWDVESKTFVAQNFLKNIPIPQVYIEKNGIFPKGVNGFYGMTFCTSKYIFATYMQHPENEWGIHVFDWDGRALNNITIKDFSCSCLAVSQDNQTMYFFNSSKEGWIFSYPLSELLN